MNFDQAIAYFGSQVKLAQAIGVTQPTVSNWKTRGSIPLLQQLRIEAASRGKLKASKQALKVSRA